MSAPMPSTTAPGAGRRVALGAIAWISSLQFFLAQAIVQSAWTTPFSLSANYISDLGNTACGSFPPGSSMYVCSPWHAAMNASFITIGVTVIAGAVFLRSALRSALGTAGLALVALGAFGFVLVGLFPENVNFPPHRLGAGLHFVMGNLGQVAIGGALLGARRGIAIYSLASGLVGLVATALLVSGLFAGLGVGGMERLAAYPLPLWTIVLGTVLWRRPT